MVYPSSWNATSGDEDQVDYGDEDLDVVEEDDLFYATQGPAPTTQSDEIEVELVDDEAEAESLKLPDKGPLFLQNTAKEVREGEEDEDNEEAVLKEILAASGRGENWFDQEKEKAENSVRGKSESVEVVTTRLEAEREAMLLRNGMIKNEGEQTVLVESNLLCMKQDKGQAEQSSEGQVEEEMDISDDENPNDEDMEAIEQYLEHLEPKVQKAYEDDETQAAHNEGSAFPEAVDEPFMAGLQNEEELQQEVQAARSRTEERAKTGEMQHVAMQAKIRTDVNDAEISPNIKEGTKGQPRAFFDASSSARVDAPEGGMEWTKKVDHEALAAMAQYAGEQPVQVAPVGVRDTGAKPFPSYRYIRRFRTNLEDGSFKPLQSSRDEFAAHFRYQTSDEPRTPDPDSDAIIRQEIISRRLPASVESEEDSGKKGKGKLVLLIRSARRKAITLEKPITLHKLLAAVKKDLYPVHPVTRDGRYDHLTFRLYRSDVDEDGDISHTLLGQVSDQHVNMPELELHYGTHIRPLLEELPEMHEIYVIRTFNRLWVQDGRDTTNFFSLDLVVHLQDVLLDDGSTRQREPEYLYAQYESEPVPPGSIKAELDEGFRQLLGPDIEVANVQVDRYKQEWFQWNVRQHNDHLLKNLLWKFDDPTINIYPVGWRAPHSFERAEELREKRLNGELEKEAQEASSQDTSSVLSGVEEEGGHRRQGVHTANTLPSPKMLHQADSQDHQELEKLRRGLIAAQGALETRTELLNQREATLNLLLTELPQQRDMLNQTLEYLTNQQILMNRTRAPQTAARTCHLPSQIKEGELCGEIISEHPGNNFRKVTQEHFLEHHVRKGERCALHPDCRSVISVLEDRDRKAHIKMHEQFNVLEPVDRIATGASEGPRVEEAGKTRPEANGRRDAPEIGDRIHGSKAPKSSSNALEKGVAYCNVCQRYLQSLAREARIKHLTNCHTNEDNLLYYKSQKEGREEKMKWEKAKKAEASTQAAGSQVVEKSNQTEGLEEIANKKRRKSQDPDWDLYKNSSDEERNAKAQPEQSVIEGKKTVTRSTKRAKK